MLQEIDLFFLLELMYFDSGATEDFYSLLRSSERRFSTSSDLEFSNILTIGRRGFNLNPFTLDWFLSKFLGEHISGGNFTWFGYNAMRWAMQWRVSNGWMVFRPPHLRVNLDLGLIGEGAIFHQMGRQDIHSLFITMACQRNRQEVFCLLAYFFFVLLPMLFARSLC